MSRNQRVPKRDMLQTLVHSDAEAISIYLLSRKSRKLSGTSSSESNWVGYPVEENTEGESHESFDVLGEILAFSLQTRKFMGNYSGIARELLGDYWGITRKLRLFVYQG